MATTVEVGAGEVYEFLLDFPGYAAYSEHLRNVESHGDGGPGTTYDMTFGWWKVTYTVRSRVTDVEHPERIDFEIAHGIRANGEWLVEPVDEETSRVRFVVRYGPDSVDDDAVSLPTLVSVDWVVERVEDRVREEAELIVERVVADLEGERRDVDLDVRMS